MKLCWCASLGVLPLAKGVLQMWTQHIPAYCGWDALPPPSPPSQKKQPPHNCVCTRAFACVSNYMSVWFMLISGVFIYQLWLRSFLHALDNSCPMKVCWHKMIWSLAFSSSPNRSKLSSCRIPRWRGWAVTGEAQDFPLSMWLRGTKGGISGMLPSPCCA